jgi:predicted nucleic acid-binding protein
MRVVDTSLWVEYLSDGALADVAEQCIEPLSSCIVPAMVHYELAKWSQRNAGSKHPNLALSILTECSVVAMDTIIATDAAGFSREYKLHATDAIIYATARLHNAPLFTCDSHFKDLPGVKYFEK